MEAIAKKRVSPLIVEGTVLIRKGKIAIVEGHKYKGNIKVIENGEEYNPPNWYAWKLIELSPGYFQINK